MFAMGPAFLLWRRTPLVGLLPIGCAEPWIFTIEHFRRAKLLAILAATAIHNAQLYEWATDLCKGRKDAAREGGYCKISIGRSTRASSAALIRAIQRRTASSSCLRFRTDPRWMQRGRTTERIGFRIELLRQWRVFTNRPSCNSAPQ